jgi:hypothetical protein
MLYEMLIKVLEDIELVKMLPNKHDFIKIETQLAPVISIFLMLDYLKQEKSHAEMIGRFCKYALKWTVIYYLTHVWSTEV